MEKDDSIKISLSTAFLIIAIILIAVMGFFMYRMYNKIGSLSNEVVELNKNSENMMKTEIAEETGAQDKNEEINKTSLNKLDNEVIEEEKSKEDKLPSDNKSNDIFDSIKNDKVGKINHFYQTQTDILETHKSTSNSNESKYAVVDINEDGNDDLIVYAQKDELTFNVYVYIGSKDGLYLADTPLVDAHSSHYNIIKEKGKNYLTIIYGHMGVESITHIYYIDNGVVKKTVLDHEVEQNQDYESENLVDTLKWKNI